MKRFGLFIIGDEILSGKRTDKHLSKVIELLSARGLALSWAHYLGDDREAITAAYRQSFAGDDVVFSTGGIGATPDDHTRQAAAAALGVRLALHPQAETLIALRIAEMGQPLSDEQRAQRMRMGEFPEGASIIENPYNRIPGFSVREHYFVPGFPVMAWPMIESVLDTHYSALFHHHAQVDRSMLVFETPESAITPLMEAIEAQFEGVKVYSLPSVGDAERGGKRAQRHIELGVKGAGEQVEPAYRALRDGIVAMGSPFDEETA